MTTAETPGKSVRSLIPARIDRLPWSPFHTRMVMALGIAWILDGLEIQTVNTLLPTMKDYLHVSPAAIAATATVYLIGQVVGALGFGRLSDKLGRKKLFVLTLAVYLLGSGLGAVTLGQGTGWLIFLYVTRFIAGMGIGGEYTAINAAIDELIPAKYRGRVDIGVNGTYWGGALISSLLTSFLLNEITGSWAWRIAFLLGPVIGLFIIVVRRNLPESPRWQVMHGKEQGAEESISYIEREVAEKSGKDLPPVDESKAILLKPEEDHGYLTMLKVLFVKYPKRSFLGATLMITQSFLYNAIFFTTSIVLTTYLGVGKNDTGLYLIPFCFGNLVGPLVLGKLFDTIGRKKMISGTYIISGVLLIVSALLFKADVLDATTQTIAWCVIFFFASAGASAAYLTVSEIFPLEVRGQAIAIFFAIAQIFGALGPVIFGLLIDPDHPDRTNLMYGYIGGAVIMILGGVVAATLGINAEGKSLEDVAPPLSAVDEHGGKEPVGAA